MESRLLPADDDGRIVIPPDVVRELDVKPGDQISIQRAGSSLFVRDHGKSVVDRIYGIGRRYVTSPPLEPDEERRRYGEAVAEDNWSDLERQRLDWELEVGQRGARAIREEG